MNEALFDIVFKGKFSREIDKNKAILHFSKLFKMPTTKAELFFNGKPRVLKESLNLEKASHFRAALKKAGLRVSLVKQVSEELQSSSQVLTMSEAGVVIINKPFIPPKHFDTGQFELDELGVEIVHAEPIEALEFDLGELEIDELGAQIIEKEHVPEPNFDVADITIEEVGAIFAEKPDVPEPEFDLSDIDIDEVGAILMEKEKIPEPDINIDAIELAD